MRKQPRWDHRAFKEWEKRFDRPYWWLLIAVIVIPLSATAFSYFSK